ncbi:hypothetical protein HYH02_000793 [Chlamydomonas schloesseri]|uniref:SGNH hydrolase-type esterase domain-containing protein n=1 Tax=Chlamydomonas schloesseri TaxID=2026947 RepID=A0A835WWZ8_9CHLO|nr:hypothetical protein HYH02_000793 [Chlamydomonas schloesseri]|eukprot:KAG2454967.1 hypothetical protein HYH02_000793 [Chlamydomonas schloesseri]
MAPQSRKPLQVNTGVLLLCLLWPGGLAAAQVGQPRTLPSGAVSSSSSSSACTGDSSRAPCTPPEPSSRTQFRTELPLQRRPQVVVFGDSMSDVGNVFSFTGGYVPSRSRYWAGRFADGPGWLDHLAAVAAAAVAMDPQQQEGGQHVQEEEAQEQQEHQWRRRRLAQAEVLDFAYGGSTACASRARVSAMVPDLAAQVDSFLAGQRPAATATSLWGNASTAAGMRPLSTTAAGVMGRPVATSKTSCTNGLLRPQPRWLLQQPAGNGSSSSRRPNSDALWQQPSPPQYVRRVIHVWTGHNDFLGGAVDWSDPAAGPVLAANVSACIGAALDRLVAAAQQEAAAAELRAPPPAAAAAAGAAADVSTADAMAQVPGPATAVTYLVLWTLAPVDLAPALPDAFRPQAAAAVAALNADLAAHVRRIRRQQQIQQVMQDRQQGQRQKANQGPGSGAVIEKDGQPGQPLLQQKRKLRRHSTSRRRLQSQHSSGAFTAAAPAALPAPPAALVVPLLFDAHAAISCAALQPEAAGLRTGNTSCLQFPPPRIEGLPGYNSSSDSSGRSSGGNSSAAASGGSIPLATGAFLQIAAADAATPCADAGQHLWYDGMHLTAAANSRLLAGPLQRAGLGLLLPAL